MKKIFSDIAWDEYLYWQSNDKRVIRKINELIKDIERNKFKGIGKPEPLKHSLSGYWARRITVEHRLVYRIIKDEIHIAQLRFHY